MPPIERLELPPRRLQVVWRLAFFLLLQMLAVHELAVRSSAPDFFEAAPDVYALFVMAVVLAVFPLSVWHLRRFLVRTPVLAADRYGLHFDCNLLGPSYIPWIFVEKVETGGCGFNRCLVLTLSESGLDRLGFWRRLLMSLGIGGRTYQIRLPDFMYPGSCVSVCELLSRFHGGDCKNYQA